MNRNVEPVEVVRIDASYQKLGDEDKQKILEGLIQWSTIELYKIHNPKISISKFHYIKKWMGWD
jgi:hypothetical protein